MLAEIRTVESEAAAFFDQISRYFITRGKVVTKVTKCIECFHLLLNSDSSSIVCDAGHEVSTRRRLQGHCRGAGREGVREPQVGHV